MTKILWPQFGNLHSPAIAWSGSGGGPASEPITYTVLDPYNNQTGLSVAAPLSVSQSTPIAGSNGSAAIAMAGHFGVSSVTRNPTPWTPVADGELIAYLVEPPDDPMEGEISNGTFTAHLNHAFRGDTANNEPVAGGSGARYGARWISMAVESIREATWAGASLASLTGASYSVRPNITLANIVGQGTTKIGPIVRVTERRKPILCMTHDDHADGHLIVRDMMMARFGYCANTSYTPVDLIGLPGRLSLSDMTAMRAQGWAFALDSGPIDEPIWATHGGTVADAVTAMNAHRNALVATGTATFDEASHLCWSYSSQSQYNGASVVTLANVVSAGGTTLTCGSANGFYNTGAMRGAILKAPGIPAGTTVVSCPDVNTIIVNQAVPAATYTVTFCALNIIDTNGGLVANGTTAITSIRTSGLVVGMEMQGRGVPAGTTITAIDSESTGTLADGTITVSNAIPAACVRGAFFITNGEWLPGRVEAALLAAGFKSGRRTKLMGGGLCTQFGIPSPMAMMSLWSQDFEPGASAGTIGAIRMNIRDGRDMISLSHNTSSFNQTIFGEILDYVKTRVDAGELDIMTVPAWYNRIAARSGLA